MTDDLIDRIYESSFVPELWPGILDALSNIAGARGGVLFAAHSKVLNWTASANLAETFKVYVEDGWLIDDVAGGAQRVLERPAASDQTRTR